MPFVTFDESSSGVDSEDEPRSLSKADGIRQIEERALFGREKTVIPATSPAPSVAQPNDADVKQAALRQIEHQRISAKTERAPVAAESRTTSASAAPIPVPASAPPGAYRVIFLSEGCGPDLDEDAEQPRPLNETPEDHDHEAAFTAVVVDEEEERERMEQATRESIEKTAVRAEVVDTKKRRRIAVCAVALVLIAAITLTVLLFKKSNSNHEHPRQSPTVKFVDPSEWVAFANEITLSPSVLSYPAKEDPSTEERALTWLIEEDELVPELMATQRFAFVVLAFATNVPDWNITSGFDECELKGVTCDSDHTAIEIDVTTFGLDGTIPDDIALLSSVRKLVFWDNVLTGTVPWDHMMAHMTEMIFLDLDVNTLTGPLPNPTPGVWPKLEIFWASRNEFDGTLSSGFANLPVLHDLYVRKNQLTGTVPSELGKITTLKWFAIDDNALHGSLPTEIGHWTNLNYFEIEGNGKMTGTIPTEVGRWTALKSFFCHSNKFRGTIPNGIENWSDLIKFQVHFNDFTGPLPSALGSWTNLEEFHIHNNAFTGPLPRGMDNWTELLELKADYNKLTGTIPEDLGSWTRLKIAQFQVNSLTGTAQSICGVVPNGTAVSADCCEVVCKCCTSCFTDVGDQNCKILS